MEPGRVRDFTLLFFLLLTCYLVWPLLDAVVIGLFTAYLLIHVREELEEVMNGGKSLSGWILSISIVLVVSAFVFGVTTGIITFGKNIGGFTDALAGSASFVTDLFKLPEPVSKIVSSVIDEFGQKMRLTAVKYFRNFPSALINFFIYLVSSFYFFFYGEQIRNRLFMSVEKMDEGVANLIRVFLRSIYDLFNGVFIKRTLMGLSVFLISNIGFYLLGVEFWLGWAVLMGAIEFIPLIGNFIVYIPLGILYIALGLFWKGMLIILFGLIFLETFPELFIKPRIEVPRIKESSFLIFLGIVSGVSFLGPMGVFVGPTLLTVFRDLVLQIYREPT